ncbi:MAG: S8 family serine peptidase, partial [Candidatus Sulfomarinibacteraceae bacterium]
LTLDHPSFAADGGDGYVHTNPNGAGNYLGLCASNPGTFVCNDKLIGYWIFTGELTDDTDGHGSLVASVAVGNHLAPGIVNLFPFVGYSPQISGVAPHANLVGYDACNDSGGCPTSATLGAIDQAGLDGVDVFNYSIGGGASSPWTHSGAQAMLAAGEAGVVVVTSAGNTGPGAATVSSPANAPWVLANGAASHPRKGINSLVDMAGGNGAPPPPIQGKGLSNGHGPAPIVLAANSGDPLCLNPFPPGTWSGEIVVCDRGTIARVAKGFNVLAGGAGGLVLVNTAVDQSLNDDVHHLPAVHIDFAQGQALKAWLTTEGISPQARISGTAIDVNPANGDILWSFSSRGPNLQADVLKPDLAAPGHDILGAHRTFPPDPSVATMEFTVSSGTSFASPHVTGAAALVRAVNPSWTPAEVRSALSSTASPTILVDEGGLAPADPFDAGSGRADVPAAASIGLVMDETGADFTAADPAAGGDPTALNLPSLVSGSCCNCSWTRVFTAVEPAAYNVSTFGAPVAAAPSTFALAAGESQAVVFTASTGGLPLSTWSFGSVEVSESGGSLPTLRLPVAIQPPGPASMSSNVHIEASAPTGSELVQGLVPARNVTDFTAEVHGLTKGTMVTEHLTQDPTNGDPYDNLNDGTTFVVPVTVPAGARRLVAEIVASTAIDMDLPVGSGPVPSAATNLCSSTSSGTIEFCRLDDPPPGDYWILVQNWAQSASPPDLVRLSYAVVGPGTTDHELTVAGPATAPACDPFDISLSWYVATPRDGDRFYGLATLGSSPANPDDLGVMDVSIVFDNVERWLLCSSPALAIPDNGSAFDIASVSESLNLTDLKVHIDASHTWVGDLIFTLEHIGGATATLIDRPGVPATTVGCGEDDIDVVVDDQGTGDIESQCDIGPAISGYRIGGDPPSSVLSAFIGEDLGGDWMLTVSDNELQDTGSLLNWCLDVSLGLIFADGFESGDPSQWSSATP